MSKLRAWLTLTWWWLRSPYALGFSIRIERHRRASLPQYARWLAREGDGGPTTKQGLTAARAIGA